jgi:hypothetical protein
MLEGEERERGGPEGSGLRARGAFGNHTAAIEDSDQRRFAGRGQS